MSGNEQGDYGDDQGTKVGAPDQKHTPAAHSDEPPDRAPRRTGAGAEAMAGTETPVDEHDREHRGGYGGSGGNPVSSSDERKDG